MAKQIGELEFWYKDYIEDEFNGSVDCTYEIWGVNEYDGLTMEKYYTLCKQFAAAMGFDRITINKWFDCD